MDAKKKGETYISTHILVIKKIIKKIKGELKNK